MRHYSGFRECHLILQRATIVAYSTTHSLTVSTKRSFSFVLLHTFFVLATFYNNADNIQTEYVVFVFDTPVSDINRCFHLTLWLPRWSYVTGTLELLTIIKIEWKLKIDK